MTKLMDTIKGRRSIRLYQEKPVPDDALNQILDAVRWAPSWANTQCWEVVVIKDGEIKKRLQEILPSFNPVNKALGQAPVTLALCGQAGKAGYFKGQASTKFGEWMMFDLGIAAQNICLAAHDLGLATVIAGAFDHDKAKETLGIPEGYEILTLIPLGYAAQDGHAPKRRETKEFTHWDRF